jgi:uncharacterized membrane protein
MCPSSAYVSQRASPSIPFAPRPAAANIMEEIHRIVETVVVGISSIGALVALWGVVETVVGFVSLKVRRQGADEIAMSESLRQKLGAHLLLGLEIFIAGDVISSVVSPTWNKVGLLAAIVGIRTVLSYFLRMEIRQTRGR